MDENMIADICNALLMGSYHRKKVKDVTHYQNGYFVIHFTDETEVELQHDNIARVLREAEDIHPYKQPGDHNTYCEYNEGWCDAIDYITRTLRIGL